MRCSAGPRETAEEEEKIYYRHRLLFGVAWISYTYHLHPSKSLVLFFLRMRRKDMLLGLALRTWAQSKKKKEGIREKQGTEGRPICHFSGWQIKICVLPGRLMT